MKPRTRRALLGSIQKWEAIVVGTGADEGTENCPLCKVFYDKDCEGCPVSLKTVAEYCNGSPYVDWSEHLECEHGRFENGKVECPECLRLAQAELDFLKSLLPS